MPSGSEMAFPISYNKLFALLSNKFYVERNGRGSDRKLEGWGAPRQELKIYLCLTLVKNESNMMIVFIRRASSEFTSFLISLYTGLLRHG